MLPQLSLFQQCPIQSQDVMQTWLHWRRQDAQLVQKHFLALFHPKPNECLHFDLESCNLMCTYTVVTHPCHIPPLAQARPMMLCIYTSCYMESKNSKHTGTSLHKLASPQIPLLIGQQTDSTARTNWLF